MELRFPHRIEYKIHGPVSVEEVIATLRANHAVTQHLGTLLEELMPGLQVSSVNLQVDEVALGSLKELFTIAVYALYQETLDHNVPILLNHLTGVEIAPEYNKVVTCAFLLLLYYGVEFLQKVAIEKLDATILRQQLDVMVSELSRLSGRTESQIKRSLEVKFNRKSTLTELGRAAIDFFSPSRMRNDEPILVDELVIEPEVIKAVPKNINEDALDDDIPSKPLMGVSIEVRATDSDKDSQGWAGIIRTVSDKRLVMRLFPGIDREALRKNGHVIADVIVSYKDRNGVVRPSSFDLVRVHDEPPPTSPEGN